MYFDDVVWVCALHVVRRPLTTLSTVETSPPTIGTPEVRPPNVPVRPLTSGSRPSSALGAGAGWGAEMEESGEQPASIAARAMAAGVDDRSIRRAKLKRVVMRTVKSESRRVARSCREGAAEPT